METGVNEVITATKENGWVNKRSSIKNLNKSIDYIESNIIINLLQGVEGRYGARGYTGPQV